MEKLIKQFHGFSGSKVYLFEEDGIRFVRKIDNIDRNAEQLKVLFSNHISVPKILRQNENVLDMQYIDGFDMNTYITSYGVLGLQNFLENIIAKFSQNSKEKNYYDIYEKKLTWIDNNCDLLFSKEDLLKKLPCILPESLYHGDLTLQNIIFAKTNDFYLIDPLTTEYDSWVFDFYKLRQDISCHWFIRDQKNNHLITYLKILENYFLKKYDVLDNKYLFILILLRVLPYAKPKSFDYFYLINEVNRLWI